MLKYLLALFLTVTPLGLAFATDCVPDVPLSHPLFTSGPMAYSSSVILQPLGNVNQASHIRPSDHMYATWNDATCGTAHDVLAMAPLKITAISVSPGTDGSSVPDYRIDYEYTCGVTGWYQHLRGLSDDIRSTLINTYSVTSAEIDSPTGGLHRLFPPDSNQSAQIPITSAGHVLGTVQVENCAAPTWDWLHSLDIGVKDRRFSTGSVANSSPIRHSERAAVTFMSYLAPELLTVPTDWSALVASTSIPDGVDVASADKGGSLYKDIPFTLQGGWFNPDADENWSQSGMDDETAALTIVPNYIDVSKVSISWGTKNAASTYGSVAKLDPNNWIGCDIASTAIACSDDGRCPYNFPASPSSSGTPVGIFGTGPIPIAHTDFNHLSIDLKINPDPSTVTRSTGTVCYSVFSVYPPVPNNSGPIIPLYDGVLFAVAPNVDLLDQVDLTNLMDQDIVYAKYFPIASADPCVAIKKYYNNDVYDMNGLFPAPASDTNSSWKKYVRTNAFKPSRALTSVPVPLSKVMAISGFGNMSPGYGTTIPSTQSSVILKNCNVTGGCSVTPMADGNVFMLMYQKDGQSGTGGTYSVYVAHASALELSTPPSDQDRFKYPVITQYTQLQNLGSDLTSAIATNGYHWFSLGKGQQSDIGSDANDNGPWLMALKQTGIVSANTGFINVTSGTTKLGNITTANANDFAYFNMTLLDGNYTSGTYVNTSVFRYPNEFERFKQFGPAYSSNIYWFLPHTYFAAEPFAKYLPAADQSGWLNSNLYFEETSTGTPNTQTSFEQLGQDLIGTIQGVWFNPKVDRDYASEFYDPNPGAVSIIPSARYGTLAFGFGKASAAHNQSNADLALLDPMKWDACNQNTTSKTDATCLLEGKRIDSIDASHIDAPFNSYSPGTTAAIDATHLINPKASAVTVGKMAYFDLGGRALNTTGISYWDQMYVYLKDTRTLQVLYIPRNSATRSCPGGAGCPAVAADFPDIGAAETRWKIYKR